MLKLIISTALTMCLAVASPAQQSLSLNMGIELPGLGYGYTFQQNGNVLQRGGAGYYVCNLAFNAKLRYRFYRYMGLELSYNLVEYDMGVHDEKYLKANNLPHINSSTQLQGSNFDAQPGYVGGYKYYSSPGMALYGYIPLHTNEDEYENDNGTISLYVATGMLFNHRFPGATYINTYVNPSQQEALSLTTHFDKYFPTYYAEAGISMSTDGGFLYNIGLKYTGGGTMMHADYTDIANSTLVNEDHVTANASYFSVTFTMGYNFWTRDRQYDRERKKKEKEEEQDNEPEIIVRKGKVKTQQQDEDDEKQPRDVTSRDVSIAATMTVHCDSITIKVWDDGTVDGDIISLNLNGEWILTDYTLKTEKYVIKVPLPPGESKLILYTESEGKYKPCTAAVQVIDKHHEQYLELSSNFQKSSCLVLKNSVE